MGARRSGHRAFPGGQSTKIHIKVRGLGCPVRLGLMAGQKGDAPKAEALRRTPRRGRDG
jgi:hypothetical protein